MSVDLVNVRTKDGVRLDGSWQKPNTSGRSEFPVDVMILHHGVTDNFYGSGPFEDFGPWLVEAGCAALRVNNRGHDPVSQEERNGKQVKFGAGYEIINDCRDDWTAWIDFAQKAGYKRIGIWGHSLGAVKSIYHAAMDNDVRVQCVIAASPPRFSYNNYASKDSWGEMQGVGQKFAESYDIAKGHVDDGHPEQLIQVEYPVPLLVSAGTFEDKYGPDAKYDIVEHIPAVQMPLLALIGTAEPLEQFSFFGLPEEMQKLSAELENFTFEYVEGANHSYSNHRKEVWELTSHWLKDLGSSGKLPSG